MAKKPRKPTAVEKKLIGVADLVITAAEKRKDPTIAIPVRALSNGLLNQLMMGKLARPVIEHQVAYMRAAELRFQLIGSGNQHLIVLAIPGALTDPAGSAKVF